MSRDKRQVENDSLRDNGIFKKKTLFKLNFSFFKFSLKVKNKLNFSLNLNFGTSQHLSTIKIRDN